MLTGMKSVEALSLRWRHVNLFERIITVGRAIPMNDDLASLLASHRAWFVDRFGGPEPEQCAPPFGSPQPTAPDRPVTDVSSGWDLVRK
jgi:integrase